MMDFDPKKSVRIDFYDPAEKRDCICLVGTGAPWSPLKQARNAYWSFQWKWNVHYKGCRAKRVAWVRLTDYCRDNDEIITVFDLAKLKRWAAKENRRAIARCKANAKAARGDVGLTGQLVNKS